MPAFDRLPRLAAPLLAAATLAAPASAGFDIGISCDYSIGSPLSGYVPDFDQIREQGPLIYENGSYSYDPAGLPNDGFMYCAPAAAANWMAWLANRGYPGLAPFSDAPTNFAHESQYGPVTAMLSELGFEVQTTATGGTNGPNFRDGLQTWLDERAGPCLFDIGAEGPNQSWVPSLTQIGQAAASGKLVMVTIGWYEEVTAGYWQRDGGHVTTLVGAFDYCGDGDGQIRFRDPASDYATGDTMTQSPFASETYELVPQLGWFRGEPPSTYYFRTHMRPVGYGTDYPLGERVPFIDGFTYIEPLSGIAPGPGESLQVATPAGASTATDTILDFEAGLDVISLARTGVDRIHALAASGALVEIEARLAYAVADAPPLPVGPGAIAVESGGDDRVYVLYPQQVCCWDLAQDPPTSTCWSIPGLADDFAYDPSSGRLVVLVSQFNSLLVFDTTAPGIPTPTFLSLQGGPFIGPPQLAISPGNGWAWVSSEGSDTVRAYRIEPGGPAAPMIIILTPILIGLADLEVGHGPTLFGIRDGVLEQHRVVGDELVEVPAGEGFAGLETDGPFVLLDAPWHADEELLGPPILPTQFAPSIPDLCPGDLDGDGVVGIGDLLVLLGAWGPNPGHVADIDRSGDVGIGDLLILLGAWGPCAS